MSREKCRKDHTSKILRHDDERKLVTKSLILRCQEKLLRNIQVPVPQTDTGRQVENTKAREITLVKELGKMNP